MAYIYCFTFPDNKKYVGYAKSNFEKRWKSHQYNSKNLNKKSKLYDAIRKFGFQNISKTILVEHPDEIYTLKVLENMFIEKFDSVNNGYNSVKGGGVMPSLKGENNPSFYKRKNKKMSDWFDQCQIETHKKAMTNAHKGCKNTHARKVKIVSPHFEEYIIHGELTKFCVDYNLSFGIVYNYLNNGGGVIPEISKKASNIKNLEKRKNTTGWSIFPLD